MRLDSCTAPLLTVAYDANGNTLSDPSGRSYTWDFENRLIQAVVPGTNGGTTTFKYDPFGRRIQKSGPLGTTNYLYDGVNSLEEVDQSGGVLARYAQSDLIDEPLSEFRAGTASYYQQDGVGSVSSLSNSAGALANSYTYDSFGRLTGSTGTLINPYQYTGRDIDGETGLSYFRMRYYDPSVGRFLSEDPIRFLGGADFFAYVGNNPTNFTDWLGLLGHKPGGPYHPPGKTACRDVGPLKDSCESIAIKIYELGRMIGSHGAFQLAGQDHTQDIADQMVQLNYCMFLYGKNCKDGKPCKKKQEPDPSPDTQPNPVPGLTPTQTFAWGTALGTAAALAEEYGWLALLF